MIKYVVIPGTIISATDGKEHSIDANTLIKLYGVDPKECAINHSIKYRYNIGASSIIYYHYQSELLKLIRLTPQQDGNYSIERATVDCARDALINATNRP